MPDTASPDAYLQALPDDRRQAVNRLRQEMKTHLPRGFEEVMTHGMISYVVPHRLYPAGYHAAPAQPLPFISLASQKGYIALYHMGLYARPDLLQWFRQEYARQSKTKLDMGKSCIRFKKPDAIPFTLMGQLASKMTPADWIALYEQQIKK